jgi:two-component system cell cycle response regulator
MKLLIAEDDLTSRTMLELITRRWGYQVEAVADGEQAWEALQRPDPPRLLLLDWMMPRLDGISLCQRIRATESSDPPFIILLTARTETADIVAGLEAGANDYVAKPFANAELQARLKVGQRMLDLQGELNSAQQALAYQASHDALTGLLNRCAIMQALGREMARSARKLDPLCIALCDIDHFKRINDSFGHLAGDEVLREVTRRLQSVLRPYDEVGRYGGEEFLFLLGPGGQEPGLLFERLRAVVGDRPISIAGQDLTVTISCGVVLYRPPDDRRVAAELLSEADRLLYCAKEQGRNRVLLESGPAC